VNYLAFRQLNEMREPVPSPNGATKPPARKAAPIPAGRTRPQYKKQPPRRKAAGS
jgi:hypothetical protein